MITFYAGNTLRGLMERILEALPRDATGKHVVLVPDRDSLALESEIAGRFGATVNIEVLTFARLAVRVLGKAAWDCLTPEGCTMLLSKALYSVRDKLKFYRNACELPGFANEMYSALVAIRESGVSVEALRAAAEKMRGRTQDKAMDMALIYNEYMSVLSTRLDPTSRLKALVDAIPHSAEIAESSFYILDFYCFNQVQYSVIEALMSYAKEVRIGFIGDKVGGSNRRIYPTDLRERLLRMVKESGTVDCRTVSAYEPLPYGKEMIEGALFGYEDAPFCDPSKRAEGDASIRLFCAQDATEELRTVCAEICKLVRTGGYRYRDVAIVCAGGGVYDDIFRAVFAEYGVPYFRDTKVLLSEEPVVRFLMDSLAAERQNYEFDSVMKVVKNAFFAAAPADVHYFENYCRKYGINYTRFLQPFKLSDDTDDLERADEVRALFCEARPDLSDCHTVADYVDRIESFIADYGLDERFAAFRAEQVARGFHEGAKRSEQVPARLRDLFALTRHLLGDEPCDTDKFIMLMRSSLDSVKISLLPQSADCVYIGEAKDSRYERVKAMFVVGAVDGVLPEVPQAGSILSDAFSDALINALQQQNVVIYPSAKQLGKYAMFYLEQLLLLPTERLYVGYCRCSSTNELQYPSVVVDALSTMFCLTVEKGLSHTVVEQAATSANAYKVLLSKRVDLTPADADALYAHLSPEDRARYDALFSRRDMSIPDPQRLFFNRDRTNISQLETYFICPYRHFVQYGLRATERKEGVLDVRETGDILHAVLENFFRNIYRDNEGKSLDEVRAVMDSMDAAEIDRRVDECMDGILDEARYRGLNASEKRTQLERVRRESHVVVSREMALVKKSKYTPCEFEVRFGPHGNYPAIDVGQHIVLSGKIDRIDRYIESGESGITRYYVVDYKTGHINIDLVNVYMGVKVQIYAYLGALRAPNTEPVGAFYKQIAGDYEKSDTKTPAGALRGHPPVRPDRLFEMDTLLEAELKSSEMTVSFDKGVWKNNETGGMLLQSEELEDIIAYVMRVMSLAVQEISEGYIEAKPLSDHDCATCMVKNMCDNTSGQQRGTVKVNVASFK